MQINIEKKHFWIITSLIVLMIGALVFATNGVVDTDSPDKFGHGELSCVTVTSDENNNVLPGDIGAPNSYFQKNLEIISGDSPHIMAVYCPPDYTAVGGGMFAYAGDEKEVEAYVNMPTKGIKNYFTNGYGGIQKDLEGWVCGHDGLSEQGRCSVICCQMG